MPYQPDMIVSEQTKWALRYILNTFDETQLKVSNEEDKKSIREWMLENCEQDEDGNYYWEFETPITGKESYSGFLLQRRVSEFIDEDIADQIIKKYGLEDRCYQIIKVIDFDELYACNQEGIISDEDIDSILSFSETYALTKVKL